MTSSLVFSEPPLQTLELPFLHAAGVRLHVLRLDLINSLVSGNKWYKLEHNLVEARAQGRQTLLSFGGAWSNHLYALAAAARAEGFNSIGVIRGELPEPMNPVLAAMQAMGMQLHPVSRADYRMKHTEEFIAGLHSRFGDFYLIPEGGSNLGGMTGCAGIVSGLPWDRITAPRCYLALACGTATTMAGVLAGIHAGAATMPVTVIGVPVLKGEAYLEAELRRHCLEYGLTGSQIDRLDWFMAEGFHCGGYARTTPGLTDFIQAFKEETGIPIEPVYTGKLFLAVWSLISQGRLPEGSEIIVVHSGGIHGATPES